MTDQPKQPASAPPAPPTGAPATQSSGPTIHIGDEFGTAKRNLPPARIIVPALAGVLIVVGVIAFLQRAKPQASGSLDNLNPVGVSGQTTTLVAMTFTLHNTGEKPLWVHTIEAKVKTPASEITSQAVSAIDFDRYFEAFPALKANAQPPLSPEDKVKPGQSVTRTVLMAFPMTLDDFNRRQSISLMIQPYDQPVAIIMTK